MVSTAKYRVRVAAAAVSALVLSAPTTLFLVDSIYRIAEGGPTRGDAHETMVKVGSWAPLVGFIMFAPLFALSVWVLIRLLRRR